MICVKEVGRKDKTLVHLCWSRSWASTLSMVELFWADISMTNTRIWLVVYLFHGSHEYHKNEPVVFRITQGEKGISIKTVLIEIFVPHFLLVRDCVPFSLPLPASPLYSLPLQVAIALMITWPPNKKEENPRTLWTWERSAKAWSAFSFCWTAVNRALSPMPPFWQQL